MVVNMEELKQFIDKLEERIADEEKRFKAYLGSELDFDRNYQRKYILSGLREALLLAMANYNYFKHYKDLDSAKN